MALKLKGSTSGFVAIDAPSVSGNNTLILPENSGSAQQLLGNDITAGVTTFTRVTVNRNGDLTVPGTISIGGTLTYEDVTSVDSVGIVTARGLSIFGNTSGLNVTGVGTFAGDVSIADKIIHTGDTDTAIRFPSANTVTVETGGNESTRFDSGGRVLIGTSSILHSGTMKVQVADTDADAAITINRYSNDANSPYLYFQNSRSGTIGGNTAVQDGDLLGRIYFNGNGGDGMYTGAYITATVDGGVGTNDMPGRLGLWTSADGTAAPVERLRISKSGAVIIGDSMSQIGASCKLQVREDQNGANMELVRSYNSASTPTRLRFSNSRGTAGSPLIVADDDELGEIRFNGYDGNDYSSRAAAIFAAVDGPPGSDDMPGRLTFNTTPDGNTTPVERMRIDSSGRVMVGSGTYIGGAALAVCGSSSVPNTYGSFAIARIGANPTSGTVLANIRLNGGAVGTRRGAEINAFADANWTDGSSHPTYLTFGTVASGATGATERMRIHAGGNVDIKTGNLVISTAGQGIDFGATSNHGTTTPSELLDDYEEGTWNPAFKFGGGNTSINHAQQEGRYTKIGNQVVASFVIGLSNKGSSTGNWTLSGLPYTIKNDSGDRVNGILTYYGDMSNLNTHVVLYNTGNTTEFYGYYSDGSSASLSVLTDSFFTNNSHMRGHVIYRTSAS